MPEPSIDKPRRTKAEQRAESLEQMLDAAEYLFSKHGFYGVTLKDVAQRVGVHTSLMHYYFDDKKALFDAVIDRRAPLTAERRVKAMDDYERAANGQPTVEGALRAFLDTDLDLYINGGEGLRNYAALGAIIANTPEGAEVLDTHFDAVVLRLIGLLRASPAGLPAGGYLLGLPLRHRRPDANAGAHGADRQALGRAMLVGRLLGRQGADGDLHGGRVHGHLQGSDEPTFGRSQPSLMSIEQHAFRQTAGGGVPSHHNPTSPYDPLQA